MRVALVCVLGLAAAACGDDGVSIATNESNFCDEIAEVICHNMYQCCTENEIESYLGVSEPRTENQCREDVKRDCDRDSSELQDSLEAKRTLLDKDRLNDCLEAVVAPDGVCGDVVTEVPWKEACLTTPFVGQVQPMGTCFFNFDCAGYPDAFCGPDQKCKLKPTAGFPCGTGNNTCASDFYCNSLNNTCAPKADVGGMCTQDSQCNNKKDLYCDIPLAQLTMPMPMGTCAMKGAGGAPCLKPGACLSGQCAPGMCAGTNTQCYADTGPFGIGCTGHCADDNGQCDGPEDCNTSGICSETSGICYDDTNYCGECVGGSNPGVACVGPSQCIGGTCMGSLTSDFCQFGVSCVPGDCVGDPVCTAATIVTDYCSAIGVIPNP